MIKKIIPFIIGATIMTLVVASFLPFHQIIRHRPASVVYAEIITVMLLALRWGPYPAIFASAIGMAMWVFFFLPPYFTFTFSFKYFHIQEWIVVSALTVTTFIVGRLSAHIKARAEDAERSRAHIERLYDNLRRENRDRIRVEQALKEREARIRRLMEANIIGVVFWDVHGRIMDANDAFLHIVRYERSDLEAGVISWTGMTPAEYAAADRNAIEQLKATGRCAPYEKEYICKDGVHVPVLVGSATLEGSRDSGVAFVVDLSERRRVEQHIEHMARHDVLTDLPNRVLFVDRLNQAIARAHRDGDQVAVIFIDLDYFKDINDSLGHQIGDLLLKTASQRLRMCLREEDCVARFGGDEFVVCLPALTDVRGAVPIANKVLETLREPFVINGHTLHVSGSIGISLYPGDGEDVDRLLQAADTAMYHAKAAGRNNCQFFTERLNELAQRRLSIANRLRNAIQRLDEFSLYYQPEFDLKRGNVASAEALIRWRHAGEIIPTDEFISIAEEIGLIAPLGEWALRTACHQLRRWHLAGYPRLGIAVNLSPYQFRRPGLVDLIADILKESELPPEALELEITEGVLMVQSSESIATLRQLAALGVRLAIDDFGTGYSSLAYLQRFPIRTLKIDRTFVSGIGHDVNDTALVGAIIAMAHNLGLNVVAEGVENAEQEKFLKVYDCSAVQGYYYSKPVPAHQFSQLLRDQRSGAPMGQEH